MPSGPPVVCQQCAASTFQTAAPFSCPVCGQQLNAPTDVCVNALCSQPGLRYFEFNHAIAMKTGELDTAVKRHKYGQKWGWGVIFARVLLGHLARDQDLGAADLIIPMPGLSRPEVGATPGWDHVGHVIESAIEQADVPYPFRLDPPVIVKGRPTGQMAATRSMSERTALANDIYEALEVIDQGAVASKTIVVFDDVFTTGSTLNAVARRLREAGARRVLGVTLARQPWAGRSAVD